MDLSFSDQETEFRHAFQAWLRANVEPGWRARCGHDPRAHWEARRDFGRKLFDAGWASYGWPTDLGGRAQTAAQAAIFAEERALADAPEAGGGLGLIAQAIAAYGRPAQRDHLPAMQRCDETWCIGYSEPDAGSDLPSIRTRASRADEQWSLSGRKVWTSWAQFADYCFLLARTGARESREKGLTLFLLDMKTPGIHVRPLRQATGQDEFNEVVFDDVRMPAGAILGEVNAGWRIVSSLWAKERGPALAMRHFVNTRRALERLVDLTRTAAAPMPAEKLGELYARAFTSQLLAFELLAFEEAGGVPDGFGSVVKLFVTDTWRRQGREDVLHLVRTQLDAADDRVADDWLFDFIESMHYTISAGTSEIQRNTIARAVLKLPTSKR
jgi:alkylation response protein AidB-like acyl-CoA dehydrogenase